MAVTIRSDGKIALGGVERGVLVALITAAIIHAVSVFWRVGQFELRLDMQAQTVRELTDLSKQFAERFGEIETREAGNAARSDEMQRRVGKLEAAKN